MATMQPKYLILAAAVLATLPAAFSANAQSVKPAAPAAAATAAKSDVDAELEKVVVTARRVSELLQDVPLSIQAFTGKELADRGISSIADLSLVTPGLSYSPDFGRAGERPVVRGISVLRTEAPPPVAVFVDGVYVRDGVFGVTLDDAQRVEVVKGPQSALYGRSTYAGAINYISVKPGDEFKGKAYVTVGSAGERTYFGALTVPMIAEKFSARIRYKDYKFDGQYTNSQTGNKLGSERSENAGITLSFTPTKSFDALLTYDSSKDRDGIFPARARPIPTQAGGVVTSQNGSTNLPNGAVCNGRTINIVGNNAQGFPDAAVLATLANRLNGYPCGAFSLSGTTIRANENDLSNYTDPATGTGYGNIAGLDRQVDRTSLTMNYSFDSGMTLTAQLAETKQQTNNGLDQSYSGGRISPFGTSWLTYSRNELKYKSNELRLSSSQDQALTWLLGAFDYREDGTGIGSGVILASGAADPMRPQAPTGVKNGAQFGRVQYEFTKQLRVSVEGRYSKEKVTLVGAPLGVAAFTVGTCVAGQVCRVSGERTFSDFAPRFTVDYKLTPNTMLYAQSAKGSKSGGFNGTPGLPSSSFTYEGEKIQSFEMGAKNQLADNLMLNVALFQNNISGLQLSQLSTVTSPFTGTISTTTAVINVGKARTRGLEAEVSFRPVRWLALSGNYAFTDAVAIEGTEIANGTVFGGNRQLAGFKLPRSPKHSVSTSTVIDVPLSGGWNGFARADVMYQSRRYSELQSMIWADPFTRINLNIGARNKEWRITAFAKNLANDNTSLNGFRYNDATTFRRTAVDFLPRLRQYGVTVAYDFK